MKRWTACSLTTAAACLFAAGTLLCAETPQRISQAIDPNNTVVLPHSVSPRIAPQFQTGSVSPATPIGGITLVFQPSPQQKAALDALVQAQQTPGSPEYHQWLTPAEYAARFGMSASDLAQVESWLESQGFNIDSVSASRVSITFSGTAEQVQNAFQTQLNRYLVDGRQHWANATNLSIPAALQGIVLSVQNLNDFRPHPNVRPAPLSALNPAPAFTSAQTGDHYLTPGDVATIYDINPAYQSGYDGTGETIAIVGQSAIAVSDIENFQKAAGLPVKDPTITFLSGTGTSTAVQGDEAESDLDIEYSGAIAKGATIDFIYVGNNSNDNVFNSLEYAITQDVAPVISISYGACELQMPQAQFASLEGYMKEAAAQGQTIVAAAGDDGSTACFENVASNKAPTAQQEALSVNYPASSDYVTGVGGTEFPAADVASGNSTYWQSASGSSDVISSALSYIPEKVWNDDSSQQGSQYALSSGGGGVSSFAKRPSWQTGVSGLPSGSYRLVPDVSLDSSNNYAPYLYCTSDSSAWSTGSPKQQASCDDGFRDSATGLLTAAGGTSFAAPIFAGMIAIVDQRTNSRQGVAAAELYSLASSAANYSLAFHDITSGGNQCTAGSSYCSSAGAAQYAATAGYDEASGLGSVDFYQLLSLWAAASGGGGTTSSGSFSLAAPGITVAQGSSGTSTITVTSSGTYAGKVGFAVSGTGLTDGCYTVGDASVAAGGAGTSTLTVYTSQSACAGISNPQSFTHSAGSTASNRSPFGGGVPLAAFGLGGILLLGLRRSRSKLGTILGCALLSVSLAGFAAGCGNSAGTVTNSSTGGTSTQVAKGSYTLTVTGTDTTTSSITASTTLTLTVN